MNTHTIIRYKQEPDSLLPLGPHSNSLLQAYMRRSERTKFQIDYCHFNSTGNRRIKNQTMDVINLKVDIEVLREDILDFMDENETFDASDSKSIISKIGGPQELLQIENHSSSSALKR